MRPKIQRKIQAKIPNYFKRKAINFQVFLINFQKSSFWIKNSERLKLDVKSPIVEEEHKFESNFKGEGTEMNSPALDFQGLAKRDETVKISPFQKKPLGIFWAIRNFYFLN